jgi:hypothetical protein
MKYCTLAGKWLILNLPIIEPNILITPIFLFFDSPESFERFFIMKCSTDIKNRWMKKKELLNKSLKITASDEFVL